MWWIILSGALHNFNMYAIGTFLSPFLQRFHGLRVDQAAWINGIAYGFGGVGIMLGGWLCDRMARRRISGRLQAGALALLVSVPCLFLALASPPGAYLAFTAWMVVGCLMLYFYYPSVYATIQDIVEPSLRGTAMSLYFFAMYLCGASLGPLGTGKLSDFLAQRAANARGDEIVSALDKAEGLHQAMYLIPILDLLLVVVMVAASRKVTADYRKLQDWFRGQPSRDEGTANGVRGTGEEKELADGPTDWRHND
jgi:MFS family permease